MATEVASLFGTLGLNDKQFNQGMTQAESRLDRMSGSLTSFGNQTMMVGAGLTAGVTAPLVAAGAAATRMGLNFDDAMTNAGAVLGLTREEMADTRAEILAMGAASRAGPQAVAEAYYDVVGGVQDASTHMDILNASIATSEAGNANLAATTTGLISVMNAYGLEAEDAARVSDNLTQAVGMGVGTMDQFVGALGPASGLAYDVGVSFEELSAATAFLTSTGSSASEATTQLTGVMSAFLKPNKDMTEALDAMGFANGQAAIEALGLQGAVSALYDELGTTDAVAQALGTQEALGGALGLNNDRFDEFSATYNAGLEGATERARALQNEAERGSFDLFMSQIQATGIVLSDQLLPPITKALDTITPLVAAVGNASPELIGMGVAAAVVAASIGPVVTTVGALATAIGFLISPIGLAIVAVGALSAAYFTNFGGIRDFIDGQVAPVLRSFFGFLGDVWTVIQPGLTELFNWFTGTGLPTINEFVTGTALPAVQTFFNFIRDVWTVIQPGLTELFNWFTGTGLPAVTSFVTDTAFPAVANFIGIIAGIWESVSGALSSFRQGFTEAMNAVLGPIGDVIDKIGELKSALDDVGGNVQAGAGGAAGIAGGLARGDFGFGAVANAVAAEFRADGGPVSAGKPYIVGERGPELMIPSTSGTVVPNEALGGDTFNVNINVTEGNAASAGRSFGDAFVERVRSRGR